MTDYSLNTRPGLLLQVLTTTNNDYEAAILSLDNRLKKMWINAFSSWLWNFKISKMIENGESNKKYIP